MTFNSMLPALVLVRSGGDEWALAMVQAAIDGAAVRIGTVVTLWGGPHRKIHKWFRVLMRSSFEIKNFRRGPETNV